MPSNTPYESIFQFKIEGENKLHQGFKKIVSGLESVDGGLTKIHEHGSLPTILLGKQQDQKILPALDLQIRDLTDSLEDQRKRYNELQQAFQQVTTPQLLPVIEQQLADVEQEIDTTIRELERLHDVVGREMSLNLSMGRGGGDDLSRLMGIGFGSQSVQTSQSIGGILNTFSMGEGGFAELSRGMGDVLDQSSMLGMELEQLAMLTKESGGAFSGPLSSGLGSLARLAGPVAAGIAGVNLGFTIMDQLTDRTTESINSYIREVQRQTDLEELRAQLLRTGTTKALEDDIAALEESIRIKEDERNQFIADAQAKTHWSDQVMTILDTPLDVLLGYSEEQATLYGEVGQEILRLNTDLGEMHERLTVLRESTEDVARREAQEELDRAELQRIGNLAEMARVLDDLDDSIDDFLGESSFQRGRELAERRRMDKRAEDEHQDRLNEIAAEGKARRVEIEEQRLKDIDNAWDTFEENRLSALDNLNKALADVDDDEQERIGDINARYMDDRLEALKDHLKLMAKAESEYAKNRKRRLEDLQSELLDAEMQNNVAAFIAAENQAAQDLKRMREDHHERKSQDEAAFEEQQAERRTQRAQELDDIRETAKERRGELRDQYAEEKALLEKQRDERLAEIEAAAIEQTQLQRDQEKQRRDDLIADFKHRRDLEREDRKIRDQQWEEDQQRQIEKMRDGAEDRLNVIQDEQDDLQKVIDSGGRDRLETVKSWEEQMRAEQVGSYQNALNQLRSMTSSYSSGSFSGSLSNDMRAAGYGSSLGSRGAGFSNRLFAAKGALIDEPTLMIAGEGNRPELVLPFDESKGIPPDLLAGLTKGMGRGDLHFHGNIDLGNISEDVFRSELLNLRDALLDFMEQSA